MLNTNERFSNEILNKLQSTFHYPEDSIVNSGEFSDKLYFISSGFCNVSVEVSGGNVKVISYLKPGVHFGEVGIIHNTYRTATV